MKSKSIFLVALAFVLFEVTPTFAKTFPLLRTNMNNIRPILDARVEADFRIAMIGNAKKTIKLLAFDFQPDSVIGVPLLQALSFAAQKGVKIQIGISEQALIAKDREDRMAKVLRYLASHFPQNFEFLMVGGPEMWKHGWSVSDILHSKLLIVDDRVALVSGRSLDGDSLNWLDAALVYQGELVNQSIEAFNQTWDAMKKILEGSELEGPETESWDSSEDPFPEPSSIFDFSRDISTGFGYLLSLSYLSADYEKLGKLEYDAIMNSPARTYMDTEVQMKQFADLMNGLHQDYVPVTSEEEGVEARVIHHDFFKQALERPYLRDLAVNSRLPYLNDPILDEVIASIERAEPGQEVNIYTYAVIMPPKLKEQLLSSIKSKNLRVSILTNSVRCYSEHAQRMNLPFPVGYYQSIEDLDDLIQRGVKVYSLERGFPFLHRKMVIVGNEVFMGSHNMTLSSVLNSEELNLQIKSEKLATEFRMEFQKTIETLADPFDPEVVKADRARVIPRVMRAIIPSTLIY